MTQRNTYKEKNIINHTLSPRYDFQRRNAGLPISDKDIESKIYTIRGLQVMLDRDLAELYGVETFNLNKAVKRNIDRFPLDFMFQLTKEEYNNLEFHFGISSWGGRRTLPYVFTQEGVATLSGVLNSKKAIEINILVMRAFVSMRKFIASNASMFFRLDKVEMSEIAIKNKISEHDQKLEVFDKKQIEHDKKFSQIFDAIQSKDIKPSKGIFFDGQIFDAYSFVSDLIRSAEKSIILIDNYVDDSVLTLFNKRKENVSVVIYTANVSKGLTLDVERYNSQYAPVEIKEFKQSHDRFLIIDSTVYSFGASLKDLGKKWFAFCRFDKDAFRFMERIGR